MIIRPPRSPTSSSATLIVSSAKIENGKIQVCGGEIPVASDSEVSAPGDRLNGSNQAIAYVRPHDVEIFTGPVMVGRAAVVRYLSAAGPVAKIELALDGDNCLVEAEIGRPQLHALDLKLGQPVYVRARKARIFPVANPLSGSRPPHQVAGPRQAFRALPIFRMMAK